VKKEWKEWPKKETLKKAKRRRAKESKSNLTLKIIISFWE
jgi:hypothetical protein